MYYKTRVGEAIDGGYVEMDPSQRYGRFKDVLGKGAMKTVYRAFDEVVGVEVAWNQVKLDCLFGSPDELQRLYSEVHLLKSLNHESIMKFRASWIDVDRRRFNFITELFTSGTLREYRKKYKRVSIEAVKGWARQILEGLHYLHSHDPPVIHRDLKCDNIFVNGHLGQVKIGDLGLAAVLQGSHHAHSVIGTPEFMAPELYEEDYDELVDVYSFGMCVLEMLTSEYPYNECSNPAQIYKKVTSGKLPESYYKIDNEEARRFVGRCLMKVPNRPSVLELLNDPFLSIEEAKELSPTNVSSQDAALSRMLDESPPAFGVPAKSTKMAITGSMNADEDTIFLKVQISNKNGPARNIYFPFDITGDTSLDVATEMVKELEIRDWEPLEIANMIDDEISNLIPSWKDYGSSQKASFISLDDNEDDNDDNRPHHLFYSTSEFSSSQDSLPEPSSQFYQDKSLHDWLQAEEEVHDDTSSQCSSWSEKYSNVKYLSANDDDELISISEKEGNCISKTTNFTRFGREGSTIRNCNNFNLSACSSNRQQKMVKSGSLVDIRSQLLHRTLVEEVNKRRLFNTVGAVENIGYQKPDCFSGGEKKSVFTRKTNWESGIKGEFKWFLVSP